MHGNHANLHSNHANWFASFKIMMSLRHMSHLVRHMSHLFQFLAQTRQRLFIRMFLPFLYCHVLIELSELERMERPSIGAPAFLMIQYFLMQLSQNMYGFREVLDICSMFYRVRRSASSEKTSFLVISLLAGPVP